jgi:thiamine phosphate synthase YjbQ (UPF0047 family)
VGDSELDCGNGINAIEISMSSRTELFDITAKIEKVVSESGTREGVCIV